ncbi:MAG TPA: hypothetical protein VD838_09800, partial [Anaeromyxobacteraceae bacterium]|nr:hypothetical protein [Anaeromyxobacteraceae bacterium]
MVLPGDARRHALLAERSRRREERRHGGREARQQAWAGFRGGEWQQRIDVRDFIQRNYTPYTGDEGFLADATPRTRRLWEKVGGLLAEERKKGVLDVSQE